MSSLINKQLLLTAYAYLFIMEQQKAQQESEALHLEAARPAAKFKPNVAQWANLSKHLKSSKQRGRVLRDCEWLASGKFSHVGQEMATIKEGPTWCVAVVQKEGEDPCASFWHKEKDPDEGSVLWNYKPATNAGRPLNPRFWVPSDAHQRHPSFLGASKMGDIVRHHILYEPNAENTATIRGEQPRRRLASAGGWKIGAIRIAPQTGLLSVANLCGKKFPKDASIVCELTPKPTKYLRAADAKEGKRTDKKNWKKRVPKN